MRLSRIAFLTAAVAYAAACGSAPGAASSSSAGSAGSAASPNAKPAMATPENIAAGKQLYETKVCVRCHNVGGAGGQAGPPLNDKQWLHGNGTYPGIVSIIKDGIQQSDIVGGYPRAMPARGEPMTGTNKTLLTDDEINKIAAYVWSISHDM